MLQTAKVTQKILHTEVNVQEERLWRKTMLCGNLWSFANF